MWGGIKRESERDGKKERKRECQQKIICKIHFLPG